MDPCCLAVAGGGGVSAAIGTGRCHVHTSTLGHVRLPITIMARRPKPSLSEALPEGSDAAAADGQDEVDGWVELELPRVVGGAADLPDPAEVEGLAAVDLVEAVGLECRRLRGTA